MNPRHQGIEARRHEAHAAGTLRASVPSCLRASAAGLSLIEVMIALAITSSLLVAVAVAFNASAQAIDVNDRFFRATQSARVSMNQIVTAARRCQAAQVVGTDRLELITAEGSVRAFQYDSSTRRLQLIIMDDPDDHKTYTLAENIAAAVFEADLEPDPATSVLRLVRVTLTLTVEEGNNRIRLSGSAVPRRAMVY